MQMTKEHEMFLDLLRYVLGNSDKCGEMDAGQWKDMYAIAQQHKLAAAMLGKLKALPCGPDEDTVLDWTADALLTIRESRQVTKNVAGVVRQFEKMGYECCLLKGQGNALMYPNPEERTPGDIDIWLRSKGSRGEYDERAVEEDTRRIIALVRKAKPGAKACYHHIDCSEYKGTEVEIHYRPQFVEDLQRNTLLQKFFFDMADSQFANKVALGDARIAVPTPLFNIVMQLSHMQHHLLVEGIGLRHVMDYYYLLTTQAIPHSADYDRLLGRLGLNHTAGALMWILTEKLGMDYRKCIVEPDMRRGRFMLQEIMLGGNFGSYDSRFSFGHDAKGHNLGRLWRDVRMMGLWPREASAEPVYRLWHAWWRRKHRA